LYSAHEAITGQVFLYSAHEAITGQVFLFSAHEAITGQVFLYLAHEAIKWLVFLYSAHNTEQVVGFTVFYVQRVNIDIWKISQWVYTQRKYCSTDKLSKEFLFSQVRKQGVGSEINR